VKNFPGEDPRTPRLKGRERKGKKEGREGEVREGMKGRRG
jgi:hypothetical protein